MLSHHRRCAQLIRKTLSSLVVMGGLLLLSWPAFSDYMATVRAEATISRMEAVYDTMQDEEHTRRMAQAHAYNRRFAGLPCSEDIWDYDDQLVCRDAPSSMMAWVDIPKIHCKLPVYHHTTESVLMAGVGHVDTTALPVGGMGTICALSGHSGMSTERMFDDIRRLSAGDHFVVWTLGEPFEYQVCEIHTVDPTDASVLEPQGQRDLCALITCTPLNVNTHRLVVVGERCSHLPNAAGDDVPIQPTTSVRTVPLAMGGLVIAMAALTVCVRKWCGREH